MSARPTYDVVDTCVPARIPRSETVGCVDHANQRREYLASARLGWSQDGGLSQRRDPSIGAGKGRRGRGA